MSKAADRKRADANRAAREWILAEAKFEHPILRPLYVLAIAGLLFIRALDLGDIYRVLGFDMAAVESAALWYVAGFGTAAIASLLGHGAQRAHFAANCQAWEAEQARIDRLHGLAEDREISRLVWDEWGRRLRQLAYFVAFASLLTTIFAIIAFPLVALSTGAAGFRWTGKNNPGLKASVARVVRFWEA